MSKRTKQPDAWLNPASAYQPDHRCWIEEFEMLLNRIRPHYKSTHPLRLMFEKANDLWPEPNPDVRFMKAARACAEAFYKLPEDEIGRVLNYWKPSAWRPTAQGIFT